MTAKEMFEELGYEIKDTEYYIEYFKKNDYIQFWKNNFNKITVHSLSGTMALDIRELQAINKQIEELGWKK